jgi:hypothetical protein
MGCGGTCPACQGYAEEKARCLGGPLRYKPAADSPERAARDPRYAWLPP